MDPTLTLYLCRTGLEAALTADLRERDPAARDASPPGARGYRVIAHPQGRPPRAPGIFEHQRIPEAARLPPDGLNPIPEQTVDAVLDTIPAHARTWTVHAYAASPDSDSGAARRAKGFADALLRVGGRRRPDTAARMQEAPADWVLQLCLTPAGLWYGCAPAQALTSPAPGGVFRMRMDPRAPSRSYLKLEEALQRMGMEPRRGETAVDLGAAPGGWTYALARRGCRVLAVDNGPLRLQGPLAGAVRHLRTDGLAFAPPPELRPVDWLVSDMLIPPGKTLGLLRRWSGPGWMRRVVCTVKLPQQDPVAALRPLVAWMRRHPHLQGELRHLYHDRREVTLMATRKGD